MQTGVIISLAAYFILMLAIGVYAWRKTAADSEGYLLAGRDLSPKVTAFIDHLAASLSPAPSEP